MDGFLRGQPQMQAQVADARFRQPTEAERQKKLKRRQQVIDLNTKLRQSGVPPVAWSEDMGMMGDEEFNDLLLKHENDMTEAMQRKAEAEFYAPQRPQQPQPQAQGLDVGGPMAEQGMAETLRRKREQMNRLRQPQAY